MTDREQDEAQQPTEDPVDEAFVAYLRARDAGGADSRADFVEKFPDLKSQLGDLLDAADLIEQLARPTEVEGHVNASAETRQGVERVADDAEPDATLPAEPAPGEQAGPQLPFELGDYVLEQVIGRGGMGVVYRARQKNLDRPVAVKMIRSGVLASQDEIKRFSAEAKAAAKLKHSNIVAVHHFGHDAGHHYFSMDYIEGSDLAKRVDTEPRDCLEAARCVRDVARAIDYAHERGLLHRDLKPANVLTDQAGQIHVTDFGLAKHMGTESSLTASGAAIGTPNFMAPEQASGDHHLISRQSDVYSLGAILFALTSGRPPFVTDKVMKTLMLVIHKPAPSLRSVADVPDALDTIVEKCLDKSPTARYTTAGQLADDLDRFLNGEPISAVPRTRVQRALDWLSRVPIFAALSGRRLLDTSDGHRRFQTCMVLLALGMPLLLAIVLFVARVRHERIPSEPRIAGGVVGQQCDVLANELARRMEGNTGRVVDPILTGGAIDNFRLLESGEVHLAMLPQNAIQGYKVCVVAPLYYETVHVLARSDSSVQTLDGIRGRRIAVGTKGSGSEFAAEMLLESLDLAPNEVETLAEPFHVASEDPRCEIAIVCAALGDPEIADALASGQFRLIALPDAEEISLHHAVKAIHIKPSDYPKANLAESGVSTVNTAVFLATSRDASSKLVLAALEALYSGDPPVAEMISRSLATKWSRLGLHQAAQNYYDQQ